MRRAFAKGGALLTGTQLVSQLLTLVRNVLVARMLSQDDVGVAVALTITVQLFSMLTDMGFGKLLISGQDGDDPRLSRTVHTFQALRGLLSGLLLFLLAPWIASVFGVSEAVNAFRALAIIPLVVTFVHVDRERVQRHMRFGPMAYSEAAGHAVATAAAWPLLLWTGDYWAIVWLTLLQWAAVVVVSQCMADRPYRFGWERAMAARVWLFGAPLAVNGLVLWGVTYGDRVIVGQAFTTTDLAVFGMAALLVSMPMRLIGRVATSVMLPAVASVSTDPVALKRRYTTSGDGLGLIAVLVGVGFAAAGPGVLVLLYGGEYRTPAIVLLGLAQAIRVVRIAPTVGALACGDSMGTLHANLGRGAGLIVAAGAVGMGGGMIAVAAGAVVGELIALTMATQRLASRSGMPVLPTVRITTVVIMAGIAGWMLQEGWARLGWTDAAWVEVIICGIAGGLLALLSIAGLPGVLGEIGRARQWCKARWARMSTDRGHAASAD